MVKRNGAVLLVMLTLFIGVVIGVVAQDQSGNGESPLPAAGPYAANPEEAELSSLYQAVSISTVNITVATNDGQIGTGSGFVVDADGHIVTNNHVAGDASYLQVTFVNGINVEASLVGNDPDSDLAVIEVDPNTPGITLQPVTFADSDAAFVGQEVIAIGSPFGENFTLTAGIVSAVHREIEGMSRFSIPEVIQTDAAINPGNSGGPLMNLAGQVIGVNAQIASESGSGSGVGFAIPSNIVRRVVPNLIQSGHYQHSFLGISGTPLSPQQRESMNLPADFTGVMVADVAPGGPAEAAGLQGATSTVSTPFGDLPVNGDIITAVNDTPVAQMNDLIAYLEDNTQPGDQVNLTVWRDGQTMTVPVTLQARPEEETLIR